MAKGKVPPQLAAHTFKKGATKAKSAAKKGGRKRPSTSKKKK